MKLTKKLIEQMVKEAVKQYAVGPDQFFTQSPLDPQYDKLKSLAKTDPEMATELGYTPEIEGEEIVFSEDPIMGWIVDNYLNQPEKREHIGITNTIVEFYLKVKDVLMKPRHGDPFGKDFNEFVIERRKGGGRCRTEKKERRGRAVTADEEEESQVGEEGGGASMIKKKYKSARSDRKTEEEHNRRPEKKKRRKKS